MNSCNCPSTCTCNSKDGNYMFFGNLKIIKKHVDAMLQMDPEHIQEILSNGHDWAADHIATSKDDVEEVAGFLMNEVGQDNDDYNDQQPQFVPAGFKNHLKQIIPERIEKTKAGYFATTKTGKRLSQQAKTKRAALSQLAAVEIAKHRK